jgi:DNA-binding NarL/FixJ family response regulator
MLLRALIVDDEPIARKVLLEKLQQMETVDVVGEAQDLVLWICKCREWADSM